MKELEKKIIDQFSDDNVPLPDFNDVWMKIENKKRGKKMISIKKFAAVAVVAVSVIGFGGVKAGPYIADASETLVSKIFGENQVKEVDPYAGTAEIQELEDSLQLAKKKLTKEEYKEYSTSLSQLVTYMKKITVMENGVRTQKLDRLSKEEQEKLVLLSNEIEKYSLKVEGTTEEKLAEAKKSASYPIKDLGSLPEGYEFSKMYVNKSKTGEPIIRKEYMNGELVLTIIQSGVLKDEEDEFTLRSSKKLETFKENGLTIQYGTNEGSSLGQMKAIVNKDDGTPYYQVYVSASNMPASVMKQIIVDLTSH